MSEPYKMVAKLELMRAACGLRLPAYESRSLIVLASLINEKTGCAYPARSLLAGLVNIDERNLVRALKGLQQRGLVTIAEQGSTRRTNHYAVNEAAVIAARGVSTDTSGVSLQTRQRCLQRHVRGVSTDTSEVSLQTPKGQRRASEAQAKQQPKLSAARSARPCSPAARDRAATPRTTGSRNAWAKNYAEAAD